MDFPAWDPVLLDIPGLPIDLRWYGLMYVVGFVAAQFLFVRLARAGFFPVDAGKAPDLILYSVIGVIVGGRLGYALFYDQSVLHPLRILQVWSGGLSFHGGLIGVCVAFWLFARKHRLPVLRIGDVCALAVTPGIAAVRFANFLQGELFGRRTLPGVGWAMQFPTDPVAQRLLHVPPDASMRDKELCIQVAFGHRSWADTKGLLSDGIDWAKVEPHLDWAKIKALTDGTGAFVVPYRHPSQLYEMLGEGFALGLLLLATYLLTRRRPWSPGAYGGLFLVGYGVVRFCVEFVREPDAQLGFVLSFMSMGQVLCSVMILAGTVLLWRGMRQATAVTA